MGDSGPDDGRVSLLHAHYMVRFKASGFPKRRWPRALRE